MGEKMENKATLKDINEEFNQFIGTDTYYKHWLGFVYTDGVKAVADKYGAYWLLDLIFSYQYLDKIKTEKFQIWIITANNKKAIVEMRIDTDQPILIKQEILFTDFPNRILKLYFTDNKVLLLPSEY